VVVVLIDGVGFAQAETLGGESHTLKSADPKRRP
jgi:hypothetical protein